MPRWASYTAVKLSGQHTVSFRKSPAPLTVGDWVSVCVGSDVAKYVDARVTSVDVQSREIAVAFAPEDTRDEERPLPSSDMDRLSVDDPRVWHESAEHVSLSHFWWSFLFSYILCIIGA